MRGLLMVACLGFSVWFSASAFGQAAPETAVDPAQGFLVISNQDAKFQQTTLTSQPLVSKIKPDLVIDMDKPLQEMQGFGGAFNEQGWVALQALSEQARTEVIKQIFDPTDGLKFNICRVPIGASDYALSRYSLAEKTNDYDLQSFSLERDRQNLIPYIKAAMQFQPKLKVWASAWSPPIWMKDNNDYEGGVFRNDPKIYQAYANYLKKFVQGYQALGINLYMVVPQNEPGTLTGYPSCDWKGGQYLTFIRDYLGPLFAQEKLAAEIWIGTINTNDYKTHIQSTLADGAAAAYVSGVALQWDGLGVIDKLHSEFPQKQIMQSETDCGNWTWKPGFNKDKAPNDFTYGAYTWRKFRAFIAAGAQSYMLWNIVLDEQGKNIDKKLPWPQNSAIVIDRQTKQVTYTPMFWATKHFSYFVAAGARLVVSAGGEAQNAIVFRNPDNSLVVELLNARSTTKSVTFALGQRLYTAEIPAQSFATAIIKE